MLARGACDDIDGSTLEAMKNEVDGYWSVLTGRTKPPIDNGIMTLMEYSHTVFARCSYLYARIQRAEQEGGIARGSPMYRFRTGELRTMVEVARQAISLGSRRLTYAKMEYDLAADEM